MDSEDEISEPRTPPNINEATNSATDHNLLDKSKIRYEFVYKKFMQWRNDNQEHSFSEKVLLAYIGKMANELKPSTLWSTYSMLRNTIYIKHNVDISKYYKLKAFLKKKATGFKSKKTKELTSQQIQTFLRDAPDQKFLFTKVTITFWFQSENTFFFIGCIDF